MKLGCLQCRYDVSNQGISFNCTAINSISKCRLNVFVLKLLKSVALTVLLRTIVQRRPLYYYDSVATGRQRGPGLSVRDAATLQESNVYR